MIAAEAMPRYRPGQRGQSRRLPPSETPIATVAPGLAQRATVLEAEARARKPLAPVRAEESRWDDPTDEVRTKRPKQVRGFRRGDVLGKLIRKGRGDITQDHVIAARLFRIDWDVATHGLSSPVNPLLSGIGGGQGRPSFGPKVRDLAQARAQSAVNSAIAAIGDEAWRLLQWVVVHERDVVGWVKAHADRALPLAFQRDLNRDREMGKLVAALTRLAEHYGVDSRRDEIKRIRRELGQRGRVQD